MQYKNGISYIIKHILCHKIFFISFLEWDLCRFKQKWNMLYFVSSNFSYNLHLFRSNDNSVVFLLLTIDYLYNSILKIRFKKGSLKFNKFPNIYRQLILFDRAECSNIGGSKDGTCADGFGVCCIGMTISIFISTINKVKFK